MVNYLSRRRQGGWVSAKILSHYLSCFVETNGQNNQNVCPLYPRPPPPYFARFRFRMSCDIEEAYNCSSDLTSLCSPDKFSDVLEQKKCQGVGLNKSKLNVDSGGTIWSIHTDIHTIITLTYTAIVYDLNLAI